MNDRVPTAMHALPDGEAELTLVVRLPWEDVARLGQEAGRLASQMRRPVTLEEAVSHRLRSARSAAHAKPAVPSVPAPASAPDAGTPGASVASLPARPPAEQARQAIERINGTA
ncbi:hypothetical protein ACH4CD_05820 [Streptomyces fungicidicus]|uniref:hypothetical protein n=1 Tax=Streptomyces fungicidicus TaxID=68203 RepID=UPI00379FFB4C